MSPRHSGNQIKARASSNSPSQLIRVCDENPRGLDYKEIEEFRQKYSLARKEIYSIKSRFMSLNRMSPETGEEGAEGAAITLGEFLQTSPLVKDMAPRVASRLIQALGEYW